MTVVDASRQATLPTRLRVLVVEDEMLLAMLLQDMLEEFSCEIVGPVGRVAKAVPLANAEPLDGAILDINVAGEEVFPVACELARREIPFVFVSGYGRDHLPKEWSDRPILRKPFQSKDLERTMSMALAQGQQKAAESRR